MLNRNNHRFISYFVLSTIFTFIFSSSAFAAQFTVFNKTYTRATGKPQAVTDTFSVLNPDAKWSIRVSDGHSKHDDDANFTIYLNGKKILKSERCDRHSRTIEEKITLKSSNTLSVELRGKPGSKITVQITGVDPSNPTITWVKPLANQILTASTIPAQLQLKEDISGLNPGSLKILLNNVSIRDQFSALTQPTLLANLTATLTIPEGSHTLYAQIKNLAGDTSSKSVAFTVDRTPSVISKLRPAHGTVVHKAKPRIRAKYFDVISGIDVRSVRLKLDGIDVTNKSVVTKSSIEFKPLSDLSVGSHTIIVEVKDKAGLTATATSTFTAGTDPNLRDQDEDGFTPGEGDCNDNNANINPDAFDIPSNTVDENCDGVDSTMVPDVVGFFQTAAESAIITAKLQVGTITSDHSDTVPAEKIISQNPMAGEVVPQGTTVGFMLSLGPVSTLPPDPATVAPPIENSGLTNFVDATSFLYTGDNPIQTGVQPDAINPLRTAVLRGKVLTNTGSPLSGVTISILNQPQLGETVSRLDGMFDLVVNGGGDVVVTYKKEGYLSSSRQMNVPWQDYVTLPDVVLITADIKVTNVDLTSNDDFQVASGSVVVDEDGQRQGTILIPQGTAATMIIPGQGSIPLNNLNIRITEYTVGPQGPAAMPAELPANSAYTYAFDINADEAVAAGASEIQFTQPVIYYVDNFLDFPAGIGAPLGYYSKSQGRWVPEDNGLVIKILNVDGGVAQIDIDGTGQPATESALSALGITFAERQQLASLYSPGRSLMRVLLPHFTDYDINMGIATKEDAIFAVIALLLADQRSKENQNYQCGSIIECQTQVLGESVDVTGTPFDLNYRSDRALGRKSAYTVNINVSKDPLPDSVLGIVLETSIAGQRTRQTFPAQNNLIIPFTWNGKDVYGRVLHQPQTVTFRVGYIYEAVYATTSRFGYNGGGRITRTDVPSAVIPTRQELTLWTEQTAVLGVLDSRQQGLGGWTMNVHHTYDPVSHVLYYGDGSRRQISNDEAVKNTIVSNVVESGTIPQFDIGADGSIYFLEQGFNGNSSVVHRMYPDGTSEIVAGGGNPADGLGDNGPATSARLTIIAGGRLTVADDGTIYVGEFYTPQGEGRVRRVTPNGIITTYAGGVSPENDQGDGKPANQAALKDIRALAVGPDGALYIGDRGHSSLRKVDPDGIISTVVGGVGPTSIDFGPDGSVYFGDMLGPFNIARIWKVTPSGNVIKVAAADCAETEPDCFLFENKETCNGLVIAKDNSIYFTSSGARAWSNYIYRLNNKILTPIAGSELGFSAPNKGVANQITIYPESIAFSPDGSLYFSSSPAPIQKIATAFPGFQVGNTPISSEDGSELYIFDSSGRHLRTLSTLTGTILYQFAYDANGLKTITDRDGNITTIERDPSGKPTAIVAPFGQRTMLRVDANGYLDRVTQPNGDTHQFVTTGDGLLKEFINPKNNVSKFTYDALGQLQSDENPLNVLYTLSRDTIPNGHKITLKDALNRTTLYQSEFFENGEEHRLNTLPDGTQDSMVIRPDYSVSSTAADGTTVELVRTTDTRFGIQSPLIQSQTIRTPGGLVSTLSTTRSTLLSTPLDVLSVVQQSESLNINGKAYTTFVDIASRTKSVSSPLGRFSVATFDNQEHIVKQRSGVFEPINYTYDTRGRLIQSSQGGGIEQRTLTLTYNTDGYLADVTNVLNEKVSFIYDLKGRVLKQTLPDGRFIEYTYDGNDNLTSITPPGQPKHQFVYSTVDLVENYTPPVIVGGGQTTYLYNPAKQLKIITRPDGQMIDYNYDTAGRLSTMTTPRGTTTYSYDPTSGNLTTITAPDGGTLGYTYDGSLLLSETWGGTIQGSVSQSYNNDFQIISQSVNGGSTVNFGYDNDGLLTQAGSMSIRYEGSAGLLTGTTLGNFTTAFGYSNFGEVANDTATYNGTSYLEHQYTYDRVGRILTRSSTDQNATDQYQYTYDQSGRLTDVVKNGAAYSHYVYDTNGNRLSRTSPTGTENGTYDDQDRLLTYGSLSFTYTANGELKSKTDASTGDTTQYQYDVLGNLLQATLPDGKVIDYLVDGNDRRIGKKVNGTLVQGFLYEDALSPVAELDANNNIVSRFVYGTRINVPDYMEKGGKTYRVITDHLGSVRMVVDTSDGSIAQRIDYDEFGRVLSDTNPGFQPFGFAGGLYESATGLTRFGARDYDALTGRWTAKDPIGFSGGINWYGYVTNDPLNKFDPLGLFVFGRRPLQSTPWLKPNQFYRDPLENSINHEPFHEHGFFEDGSEDNFGYNGTTGIFSENPEGRGYVYDTTHYDDDIMREAFNNIKDDPMWKPGRYKLMGPGHHNCQDFTEALRLEYKKLKKRKIK